MASSSLFRSVAVLSLLCSAACGEYFGSASLVPGANQGDGALSDGLGACSGIENCINLDISRDTLLRRGEWTLAPKNNDQSTYVKVRDGAVLFIEPGTVIKGLANSALIVTPGSKLSAAGTPSLPIVFTSAQPVGQRTSGFWGGLLLLGDAPVNVPNAQFEALPDNDVDGIYGGNDPDDSSGVLRYTRIEFAGFAYADGREFNGLTLAGVGRGTTLDHIQVHRSSDDGIEMFGGTADMHHILLSQNEDDGFDTDLGYTGRVQFMIVQHINAKSSDPNGYESDNAPADAQFNDLPRTSPTIYNATLIGMPSATSGSRGMIIRRGAAGQYYNHIITQFRDAAIDVRNTESTAQFPQNLFVRNSDFFANASGGINWPEESGSGDNDGGFNEGTSFMNAEYDNQEVTPGLKSAAVSLTAPSFIPDTLLPGVAPPADGFFDVDAAYMGGMDVNDWTLGWAAYPQN